MDKMVGSGVATSPDLFSKKDIFLVCHRFGRLHHSARTLGRDQYYPSLGLIG
jgi:hypothetical protein